MTKRLSAATCLVVAISTALGSLPVLAVNPLPLIGALLPTQDEESEFDADAHGEDTTKDAQ